MSMSAKPTSEATSTREALDRMIEALRSGTHGDLHRNSQIVMDALADYDRIKAAAPADAGDAMRVMKALEFYANEDNHLMGPEIERYCNNIGNWSKVHMDRGYRARDILAAARRLLDAPPGVGECETCAKLRGLLNQAIERIGDEGLEDTAQRLRTEMWALAAPAPAEPATATKQAILPARAYPCQCEIWETCPQCRGEKGRD